MSSNYDDYHKKNDDYHDDLLKKTLKEDSVVVADCQVLGVVKIPASNLEDEDDDVFLTTMGIFYDQGGAG